MHIEHLHLDHQNLRHLLLYIKQYKLFGGQLKGSAAHVRLRLDNQGLVKALMKGGSTKHMDQNSLRNIHNFRVNIIMCWNAENCKTYKIMQIIFSTNGNTTFTLCPKLWTGNGWHCDVIYTDDISSWTIEEMVCLCNSWGFINLGPRLFLGLYHLSS